MSVIGPARAVLTNRTPELSHGEDHHVAHSIAEIAVQSCNALTEILEAIRKLPARVALIGMRIPTANVGESNLDPDVSLDQLRNLKQRVAERRTRIIRAVGSLILLRVGLLQHLDCFESFFASAVQR